MSRGDFRRLRILIDVSFSASSLQLRPAAGAAALRSHSMSRRMEMAEPIPGSEQVPDAYVSGGFLDRWMTWIPPSSRTRFRLELDELLEAERARARRRFRTDFLHYFSACTMTLQEIRRLGCRPSD